MKREEAIDTFRKITGLPLANSALQRKWVYSNGSGTAVTVTVFNCFGPNKNIFKSIELVFSEDKGAIQLKLRYGPRFKERLAAFLVRNGGVDLKDPLPIRITEITKRLSRSIGSPDDPA